MTVHARRAALLAAVLASIVSACGPATRQPAAEHASPTERLLPTGVRLDPAGRSYGVGSLPLAMSLSPEGDRVVLLLNGWREQGVQVVDRRTGAVVQTLTQPAAFLGLAFAPDGRTLYASGGNEDLVYRYAWHEGQASRLDSIVLAHKGARKSGTRYPAGLALSRDGRTLYVAENLADSLAVIDVATKRVVQRLATERYPYGVVVAPDGTVYVSAWGGYTVSVFAAADSGATLRDMGRIRVGRHPSALLLNATGSRLFVASGSTDRVAVVDTRQRRVIAELLDSPPAGPAEGSTPNALALSADGTRLFVAEADANGIAVFDLSAAASDIARAMGNDRLRGRVPTAWYPTAVLAAGDTLLFVSGKGNGTAPNPGLPQPGSKVRMPPDQYTLGQLSATLGVLPGGVGLSGAALDALTRRVTSANGWDASRAAAKAYPPFEHVLYIIKENRTYDQVLGDLPHGDGDMSLVYFPRPVSPNHHALAERFGVFDRFFVNAEVSADGHNWVTAAYATDYLQKTVPSQYSGRGRAYEYEGTNRAPSGRDVIPDDDVNEPANGYLWDLAQRAGITFRNYGNYTIPVRDSGRIRYVGTKPYLAAHTNERFPDFNMDIPDQRRADVWLEDLREFVRRGEMPALQMLWLPNDHTAGARAGSPTPRAYMADNDLALGRIIEALSRTPFWKNTVVFVLEDDAQNGPDHVDSHRSPLFVVSAYNRPGVYHRFTNHTDVLRTIEEMLGLESLSHFDHFGRPLRNIWASEPDLRSYSALVPAVSLDERNLASAPRARESAALDLSKEDAADEEAFNRILWHTIKGEQAPFPGTTRMPALELRRAP